jgi:hypothetical protein
MLTMSCSVTSLSLVSYNRDMHENPYKSPDPWASAEVGREPRSAAGDAGKVYDYRPRWTVIVLCALSFGAAALFFAAEASGNDRGLIINGLIELPPAGATVFYWVLAALSVGFVAAAATMAAVRLTLHQRIAFTDSGIAIPRSRWSAEETAVPFSEIVALSTSEVHNQRFLKIIYRGGKFTLTASMLPGNEDFDEIVSAVSQGVNAARR